MTEPSEVSVLHRGPSEVEVEREEVNSNLYVQDSIYNDSSWDHKGFSNEQTVAWMILQLLCLLYNIFITPVAICYLRYNLLNGHHIGLHVLDYVVDFFFVVDIYLRCKKGEHDSRMLSYDDRATKWIDIFATFPFELIGTLCGLPGDFTFAFLRSNRLFRMVRIKRYRFTDFLNDDKSIDVSYERMVVLFMAMYVSAHYFGCLFYFNALYYAQTYPPTERTWPEIDGLWSIETMFQNETNVTSSPCVETMPTHFSSSTGIHYLCFLSSTFSRYCRSQYWAIITMVTIGLGDIVPHCDMAVWVCILSLYVGMYITAASVANLTLMVLRSDRHAQLFQNLLDRANQYMNFRGIPAETRNSIRAYLTYTWRCMEDSRIHEHLKCLPPSLESQLLHHDAMSLLQQKGLPLAFTETLALHLQQRFYIPADKICIEDHICDFAFLLHKGTSNLFVHDLPIRHLVPGDFFGHSIFMKRYDNKTGDNANDMDAMAKGDEGVCDIDTDKKEDDSRWSFTVKAKTFCEVFYIQEEKYVEFVWNAMDSLDQQKAHDAILATQKEFMRTNMNASLSQPRWQDQKQANICVNRIFKPDSRFRDIWRVCAFFGIAYNAFSTPLLIAFIFDSRWSQLSVLSTLVDVFFVADLFLNLYCFEIYNPDTGLLIEGRIHISRHYRREGSFYVDLISALPFDIMSMFFSLEGINVIAICRINKIVRLSHLYEYFKWVELFFVHVRGYLSTPLRRFIRLYYLLVLACHWCACGFYFTAQMVKYSGYDSTTWIEIDRADKKRLINPDQGDGMVGYLRSVYFVLVCASTVGYGDIVPVNLPETIYVAVTMLFGGLLKPAIVGGLASLILAHYTQEIYIRQYRRETSKGVENDDIGHTVDEELFLRNLSPSLAMAVLDHNVGDIVRGIDFFYDRSEGFILNIIAAFKPEYFVPGEKIVKYGDFGTRMFVIKRGRASVSSADDSVIYAILNSGAFFGEIAMLSDSTPRSANVTALTYCDCFTLHRADFDRAGKNSDDYCGREYVLNHLKESWLRKNKQNESSKVKSSSILSNECSIAELSVRILQDRGIEDAKVNETFEIVLDPMQTGNDLPCSRHLPFSMKDIVENIVNLAITYNFFAIPAHIAFSFPLASFAIDWMFDIVLVMSFYFKKIPSLHFKTDVFAVIPVDLVVVLPIILSLDPVESNLARYYSCYLSIGRLNKLLFGRRLQFRKNINGFHLCLAVIFVGHLCACMFYFISRFEHGDRYAECLGYNTTSGTTCLWKGTWMELQMIDNLLPWSGGDTWTRYVRSLNWAIPTLVVVVIGDATPVTVGETVYVALIIVIGLIVSATIIGSIVSLASTSGEEEKSNERENGISRGATARNHIASFVPFITVFNLLIIPLRVVIEFPTWTFAIDWCLDIVLVVDIYFRRGHLKETRSWQDKLRMFASVPLDILVFLLYGSTSNWSLWMSVFRLNKICRAHDVKKLIQGLRLHMKIPTVLFFWNHFIACGWIFIHRYLEAMSTETWATRCGASTFNESTGTHNSYNNGWEIYMKAFYFTIVVISTCGYGDIRPISNIETIFNIVVAMVGAVLLGLFAGEWVGYFESLDRRENYLKKKARLFLSAYMTKKQISKLKQEMILKRHFPIEIPIKGASRRT